ncbi:carotenoid oxygenase family protein [Streptomyces sp. NPDC002688]|uniref:carotenoid oxygenase family protein n=1 Tax=Streptomyces sp. NPDC002688 TaxID=3154423 RepID=UPI00332702EE
MGNRYLEGPFAPATEETTTLDLPVTGRIPAELNGRYLRNGPNPLGLEDAEAYHWFLGAGMVHGIRLRDGRAEWYRNRWVRSKAISAALGEDWTPGPLFSDIDAAPNTHVIGHAGRTFALGEGGATPYELGYELDSLGPTDFGGTLPGTYSAHTKRDPDTGDLHAIAYFWGWPHVQYSVLNAAGLITRTVDIPVSDSPLIHDLALTDRFAVIYDLPVTFSMDLAMTGASFPYAWNDAHPSRVGLLPRDGDADGIRWFEVEPCWVFHTLNAYDDGEHVVIDLVKFPKMLQGGRLDDNPPPVLERWTLDLASGKAVQETLDDRAQEYPRIDERLVSRPHRYGYTVSGLGTFQLRSGEAVLKRDFRTGRTETHAFPAGHAVSEAVFAPASPDGAEDHGYLLTVVTDPDRGASDLVVLSAQDVAGEPVAVVHLPVTVPLGLHGSWVPDLG